jgi:hypothetical protein
MVGQKGHVQLELDAAARIHGKPGGARKQAAQRQHQGKSRPAPDMASAT